MQKAKMFHSPADIIIIAKQALEAWYLADHAALSKFLQKRIEKVEFPESFQSPFEEVRRLRLLHNQKGSDKKFLTKAMLSSGFSLTSAAAHPNCPSARYFLHKLQTVGNLQQS